MQVMMLADQQQELAKVCSHMPDLSLSMKCYPTLLRRIWGLPLPMPAQCQKHGVADSHGYLGSGLPVMCRVWGLS